MVIFLIGGIVMKNQPARSPGGSLGQTDVEPNRLRDHVVALSETFYPRSYTHLANTEGVADYIKQHLEQSGAAVFSQSFDVTEPDKPAGRIYTCQNVIGVFGAGKGRRLVIGAHYDSFGATPGADDNASGVAGLLELARLFGHKSPDREIELVAYATEEPPFFRSQQMGSYFHAKMLADSGTTPAGVLILEMIGYFVDSPKSQRYPVPGMNLIYPTRGNYIAVVGNMSQTGFTGRVKSIMKGATPLPVYTLSGPTLLPGIDFSDHRNYWKFSFPAVMITDTAFYRNNHYHELEDTADTLDYNRMADVVRGVFAVAKVL
jgi:Zn-dependent M28 family amino/carboxypeptidase